MNLNGIQCRKAHNNITVSDICANMNDNTKITYILLDDDDIAVSCHLKNTPREIMKYQAFYVETHYDILYVYIEKIKKEKKHENKNNAKNWKQKIKKT